MNQTFTAFEGQRRLAAGLLPEVALAVKRAGGSAEPIAIFCDGTGRAIDLDLRGSDDEILARLPTSAPPGEADESPPSEPRGRGRPKLGVVAREVTLLPRHWESAQRAARRRLGRAPQARGRSPAQQRRDRDRQRAARDAAYHFMSAMAGNLPKFEEASRALFADDRRRFVSEIADWPPDIRDHVVKLAYSDRAD